MGQCWFLNPTTKPACQLGLEARKPVFGGLGTTQAQTSVRIRADWSAPLLLAYREESYLDLLRAKFQFSS